MIVVAGVRFQPCGKIYDFEVKDLELAEGDAVVVESDLGLSIGKVVLLRRLESLPEKPLKPVIRRATQEDIERQRENRSSLQEARAFCLERIMARGLPMKLVCTDVTLDKKRYIFYFTAGTRIDFRELVKDLAAKFKTRIELRQIGVRDEAKLIGGFGICGREVCCRRFLTGFEPVSIKMAKQQSLALNTAKLSGVCGRLMCCLGFEGTDTTDIASGKTMAEDCAPEEDIPQQSPVVCTEDIIEEAFAQEPTEQEDKIQVQEDKKEGQKDKRLFFRRKKKRFRGQRN